MSRSTVTLTIVAFLVRAAIPMVALAQPTNHIAQQCETCETGERGVGLALDMAPSRYVHGDNPNCAKDYDSRNVDYAVQALRTASARVTSAGTPQALILSMATAELSVAVQKAAPGAFARILSGVPGDWATCRTMAVAVPSGKQITRIETTVTTPSRAAHPSGHCGLFRVGSTTTTLPDHQCVADEPVFGDPSAAFFGFEKYRIDVRSGIVAVTAKNWSEHLSRVAFLRVYYK